MLFSILVITVTHPNMTVCSVTVKCKCNQCYLNFLAVCDVRGELLTAAALITVSRSGYRPCTINFPYQKSRMIKQQPLTQIFDGKVMPQKGHRTPVRALHVYFDQSTLRILNNVTARISQSHFVCKLF